MESARRVLGALASRRPSAAVTLSRAVALAFLAAASVAVAGPVWQVLGGNAQNGPKLIVAYGCAGCHTVPGVHGANGNVGPPLTGFGSRTYIAGMLRNSPANLIRWIRDPQGVVPGNAMPNMGVGEPDARDIAAYLYTLY